MKQLLLYLWVTAALAAGVSAQPDESLPRPTPRQYLWQEQERIRAFDVEGWTDGRWRSLAQGRHVGRKSIVRFDDAIVSKVRLRVTEAAVPPLIRAFAVFHVTNFRPTPQEPLRSPWRQCGAWGPADFKDGRMTLTVSLTPFIEEAGRGTEGVILIRRR